MKPNGQADFAERRWHGDRHVHVRVQHDGHRADRRRGGAEFAIFDMEHTGWSMETIRMLIATSRRPRWSRWCASRRPSTTSSPGSSTWGRWGSWCRWSRAGAGPAVRRVGRYRPRAAEVPPSPWPTTIIWAATWPPRSPAPTPSSSLIAQVETRGASRTSRRSPPSRAST